MCASIDIKNKKQNHLKPPLSLLRIAGQILVGMASGFALAFPVVYVAYMYNTVSLRSWSFFEEGVLQLIFIFFPPVVYGLGSAVGVYLIGNIGIQTGSFLVTLSWSFIAGAVSLFFIFMWLLMYMIGLKQILLLAPVLLISPIYATCGFNSSRMYKESRRVKKTPQSDLKKPA